MILINSAKRIGDIKPDMSRILVVEDDADLSKAYKLILEKAGHSVECSANGQVALEIVDKFKPDIILLDILMPIMGGLDFLKSYNLEKHNKVKVLIFTNMENSPEVNEAYKLGATRCIIRSWAAPQGLTRIIDDVLKESSKNTAIA